MYIMTKSISVLSAVLLQLVLLCGCNEMATKRIIAKMTLSEVVIPQSFELLNEEFIADSSWLDLKGKYKLVISIPQNQCSSCRISAHQMIDSLLVYSSDILAPMVILAGIDENSLAIANATIERYKLEYPIYLDASGELLNLNPVIPRDEKYHSFLLGPDNRIILVGDPSTDYNVMKLYQRVLADISIQFKPS